LLVMAVLLSLLSINMVWVLRNCEELKPVGSGRVAPAIDLPALGGGREGLADHRGKVVLISFWATWCGPCIKEMPMLARLRRANARRGFEVLAINVEGDPQKVRQVQASHEAARQLTMLLDPDGEAARRYGVRGLPYLVLVDRDGKVAQLLIGGGGEERLEAAVERALKGEASPPDHGHPSR